jgi:Protein phosphatase 2C
MHIDTFIKQGTSHFMCEDYVKGDDTFLPTLVVADGCSSSPNTDVGARLITLEIIEEIINMGNAIPILKEDVLKYRLLRAEREYGHILGNNFLDATAIILKEDKINKYLSVQVIGDGNIFYIYDDHIGLINIKYECNAPKYLSYYLHEERMKEYNKQFGDSKVTVSYKVKYSEKEFIPLETQEYLVRDLTIGSFFKWFDPQVHTLIISTDGVESFTNKSGEVKSLEDIALEIMNFKGYQGEFLQRRMKRMLLDLKKNEFENTDDISLAAVTFKE